MKKANRTQKAAAKRFTKNLISRKRNDWRGIYHTDDGAAVVFDDYHAVICRLDFDDLPKKEGSRPQVVFAELNQARHKDENPLQLPSIRELKSMIADFKKIPRGERPRRPVYDFGENLPQVNANYLLDMLLLMPGRAAYSRNIYYNHGIYFTGEACEGVLMPIRKKTEV